MSGFLKAILIAIIAVASIIVFVNMAFFFPWYMEIIQTTFEVSQMISTENYLTYDKYEDALNGLRDKPIFRDRASSVRIEARHEDGRPAIEASGLYDVNTYYYNLHEDEKPYVQLGNLVTITVTATYPFRMQMFGSPVTAADIENISFSMTTVTTRHYKDLWFDFGPDRYFSDEFFGYGD